MASNTPIETVIRPIKGWQLLNFSELFRYRDLFYFMVVRDIKVLYKQTVLGFLWAVLNPFFSMVVFTVVFGNLAGVPSDGVPYAIFSFAGLLPWTYFAQSMQNSTNSLVQARNIFTKVYFPRLLIPMTPVIAKLVDFLIAFAMLGAMMIYYKVTPTWDALYLPVLIIIMILSAAGIGMILSAMAVQYRDIRFAMTFLTQLLMYAAPVVWPASLIEEKFGSLAYRLYGLYPPAGVIEGFRAALIGTRPMPWELLMFSSISAVALFIIGALYFRRMERVFADVA
ncbi:MAG TPA: phosphate ABC transporter permease [Cytophagales bacterium]|nr:phosphate ABC transporter permease [Cytophagales bacterium]HAP58767.1 phosphate ABC transporter permease [Cytophagales bacterium]